MSVQEIVQPELDYRQVTTSVPTYRYRQYVPENGTTIQLDTTNRSLYVFRFGAGFVLNLAKTRLQYTIEAKNGANKILALYPEHQIAAIRLETDNGVVLLDQQNWHAVNKVVRMANLRHVDATKCPQFNTRPQADAYGHSMAITYSGGLAAANATALFSGFVINTGLWERGINGRPLDSTSKRWDLNEGTAVALGTLGTAVLAAFADDTHTIGKVTGGGAAVNYTSAESKDNWNIIGTTMQTLIGEQRYDLNVTALKFMGESKGDTTPGIEIDPAYMRYREVQSFTPLILVGPKATANAQRDVLLPFDCPLGDIFPHTVLKQAQDMWFGGHSLVMSIWFMPARDWGFTVAYDGTNACTVTSITGAIATNMGGAAKLAVTTNVAFYSGGVAAPKGVIAGFPTLQVACQDSPSIVAAVQQQILGPGLTLPVQHMEFVRQATGIPATQTRASPYKYYQTFKLSLAQGSTLLRAYHAFARPDDNTNVDEIGWRCSEDACGLVNFRTYVNAQPLTDGPQSTYEIYRTRKAIYEACQLEGYASNFMYYGAPVINDFTGFPDMIDKTPSSGLALSAPTDYQIEAGIANVIASDSAYCHSVFVFLRFLRLSSAGVSLTSA